MALLYAYNFDEASGNILDATGNGRDTVLSGSLTRTASGAGHTDKGMSQSTTAAESAGPSLTGLQTAQYTIMAWVKRTSNSLDGWFAEFKDSGSGDRGILFISGAVQSRVRNAAGSVLFVTTTQPTAGAWYHVAGSYSTVDGKIHLYINGTEVGTGVTLAAPLKSTSATSHLIDALGSETIIDDLRYYDTALDAATITTLMGTPVAGASSVTGTIAGTLPAFTGSITSTVRVSGAAAGSLPAMTGSLTGMARVSGTGSGTLPALTGSVTATARASATITATLPGFTGNLSGSLELSGSLAGTLPALTGALAGNVSTPGTPATGTLSASLPALQGSVSGGVKASGTFTGQLPGFTSAVTGRARVSATLTGALQAILGALTGTAGPVVEYEAPEEVTATPRSTDSTATPLPAGSAASGRVSDPSATARQYESTATVRSPE